MHTKIFGRDHLHLAPTHASHIELVVPLNENHLDTAFHRRRQVLAQLREFPLEIAAAAKAKVHDIAI